MPLLIYNCAPVYQYKCTVLRGIDGDTFEGAIDYGFRQYMERSVRVRGIDTAELNARTEAERLHAKAALAFANSLMPVGAKVILVTAKMAIYDRIEAEVYYNDPITGLQHSLSEALREAGFAKLSSYS